MDGHMCSTCLDRQDDLPEDELPQRSGAVLWAAVASLLWALAGLLVWAAW